MLVIIVLVVLFQESGAKIYNETTNILDLVKCKIHYSRSESFYTDFYEVIDEAHSNNSILDFHFTVLAPSDAHILFSTTLKVEKNDPAYEIVLGAGGNMFSDIRRQQKSMVKASVRIKNLLNALDPQSFWIHISKGGLIEVGREGSELAFMNWKDSEPLPIKYFSFGTWPGVEAKWYFDCPRQDNNTGESKEVKRPLTHVERLRMDLLSYYDPYVRPVINYTDIIKVQMKMTVNYLSLDEYKSSMSIKGQLVMNWLDEKLKWRPNDYGNVTTMHIVGREIWQPDLALYNAADITARDILDQMAMTVTHQGAVEWKPSTRMEVWCDAVGLGYWPHDVHNCDVYLGFSTNVNNLELEFEKNTSSIASKIFKGEWNVNGVNVENFIPLFEPWSLNLHSPLVRVTFEIQRNSGAYYVVFFTPFLVIAISMLATFCVSPIGYLKLSFGCFQLILISLVLVSLAGYIPTHAERVPYLVNLYSYALIGSLVSILIAILTINLSRLQYKTNMPFRIWTVLTSNLVQKILLLPKCTVSEKYGKLDDGTASIQLDDPGINCWYILGIIIDRVSFLVYLVLILYGLAARY